jgi:hypothetical protein
LKFEKESKIYVEKDNLLFKNNKVEMFKGKDANNINYSVKFFYINQLNNNELEKLNNNAKFLLNLRNKNIFKCNNIYYISHCIVLVLELIDKELDLSNFIDKFYNNNLFISNINKNNNEYADYYKWYSCMSDNLIKYLFIQILNSMVYDEDILYAYYDLKLKNILLNNEFNVKLSEFQCLDPIKNEEMFKRESFKLIHVLMSMIDSQFLINSEDEQNINSQKIISEKIKNNLDSKNIKISEELSKLIDKLLEIDSKKITNIDEIMSQLNNKIEKNYDPNSIKKIKKIIKLQQSDISNLKLQTNYEKGNNIEENYDYDPNKKLLEIHKSSSVPLKNKAIDNNENNNLKIVETHVIKNSIKVKNDLDKKQKNKMKKGYYFRSKAEEKF